MDRCLFVAASLTEAKLPAVQNPVLLLLIGVLLGAVMGFAFLVAGTLTLLPGVFVWVWLAVQRPRWLGMAGGLIGFGGSWLVILGSVSWSCAHDISCWQPDRSPWFAIAALLVVSGALIGLASGAILRLRT